jgi:hypothetical protein
VKFCSWFACSDGTDAPGPVSYRGTYDRSGRHSGLQRVTLALRHLTLLSSVLHTICRDCLLVRCIRKDPHGYADRYRSEYCIRSSVAYTTIHSNCCTDRCRNERWQRTCIASASARLRFMLVSRCIPYWASIALYSLLGKWGQRFRCGREACRKSEVLRPHQTHRDVEEPSHILSTSCYPPLRTFPTSHRDLPLCLTVLQKIALWVETLEMLETPGMSDSSIYLVVAIFVAVLHRVTVTVYNRYFHPLLGIPGPFVASWSRLWLVYQTARCKRHRLDPTLHTKFGLCVRIALNELLINDIHQFQTIYGAGTKFNKSTWYRCMETGQDNVNLLAETHMGRYWRQRRLVSPAFTTQALQRHQDYSLGH